MPLFRRNSCLTQRDARTWKLFDLRKVDLNSSRETRASDPTYVRKLHAELFSLSLSLSAFIFLVFCVFFFCGFIAVQASIISEREREMGMISGCNNAPGSNYL